MDSPEAMCSLKGYIEYTDGLWEMYSHTNTIIFIESFIPPATIYIFVCVCIIHLYIYRGRVLCMQ